MCSVYVNNKSFYIDTTQSNSFTTEPVAMEYHMYITIQNKRMIMDVDYWIARHDAHS